MKDDYQSSSGIIKAHLSVSSLFYKSFINILDKCQSSGVAYLSVDIKLARVFDPKLDQTFFGTNIAQNIFLFRFDHIFRPKTLYLRYLYLDTFLKVS